VKIVALAGGVGGAKLAHGLARVLPPAELAIIVNNGDDFEHFGLRICRDLDTVCYTLAEIANPKTGWGLEDESYQVLEAIRDLGGPLWFRMGDRDLGTHLERTRRLQQGETLSVITRDFCRAWGIDHPILPVTNDPIATIVQTAEEGDLAFQEYFVRRQCQPVVTGFHFNGAAKAEPAPGVLDLIEAADVVVICPSNPWVSIAPILAVPGIRDAIAEKPVVAVSPLVGGAAIKGPAAKMYAELGVQPSAVAVAETYQDLLSGFVLDEVNQDEAGEI
jgi:LPPG:FO 2-phospho-L-lactate transferase